MRRRHTRGRAGYGGFTLIAIGAAGLAWQNVTHFSPEAIARVALIIGVVLVCADWLAQRSDAANAAYKLGHDVGFERGDREGRQSARPVVVPLRRPCACGRGGEEVVSAAANLVDRG